MKDIFYNSSNIFDIPVSTLYRNFIYNKINNIKIKEKIINVDIKKLFLGYSSPTYFELKPKYQSEIRFRHYHNIGHVFDMLHNFYILHEINFKKFLDTDECSRLVIAILYHDIHLHTDSCKNEEISATEMKKDLEEVLEQSDIDHIQSLILETTHSDPSDVSPYSDKAVIRDLDLISLSLPRKAFLQNTENCIKEYLDFEQGKSSIRGFLEGLLGRDHIYCNYTMRSLFEDTAKWNINYVLNSNILCTD